MLMLFGRIGKNVEKRAVTVAMTLEVLDGCILQQKAAMETQAGSSRGDLALEWHR